jgi:glucose/mannose-6-phosphate isomerase
MMRESIEGFISQFSFEPVLDRDDGQGGSKHVVIGGMGGSHLATGVIKMLQPGIELYVHRDYGLPPYDAEFMNDSLFIASSYSGNTEETLDFARSVLDRGLRLAVVTTGGELLDFAQENDLPTIQMPVGDQPRMALGYFLRAFAYLIGRESGDQSLFEELEDDSKPVDPSALEGAGDEISRRIHGKVPVIYASKDNMTLAHLWKIKFNETGKIPAFYNMFPELNHNEMTGFDVIDSTRHLVDSFAVIFLMDSDDDARIRERMQICADMYRERGIEVVEYEIDGEVYLDRILSTLLVGDWSAFYASERYGTESEAVPMVEDFKKKLKESRGTGATDDDNEPIERDQ